MQPKNIKKEKKQAMKKVVALEPYYKIDNALREDVQGILRNRRHEDFSVPEEREVNEEHLFMLKPKHSDSTIMIEFQ